MAARSTRNTSGAARHWRFGGPGRERVRLGQIRGGASISMDMIWPALSWNGGRCWAFLHDCEPDVLERVMAALRRAELARSDPHGSLTW
jgi:hypothetical protein